MAEFYKYAKRGVDSQVDWATIGSNFTKVLQDEVKFREEKKAAIEKDTNDLGNRLANTPLGESTTFNQWALNGTDQIMKARLLQDRLLRSGQLKYKDYVALRQNLTNSTNTLFGLAKTFNEQYKKIMDRSNSKDPATRSQYAELFLAGTVEGFAKFTDTAVALNPYDNTLSVTKLGPPNKDGIRSSTGEILRADEMLNFLTTKYDYYDPNTRLKPYVESMGEVEQVIIQQGDAFRAGFIKTINDPTQKRKLGPDAKDIVDRYEQWEKNTISAEMEPTNKTSMLTNSIKIDPISKKPYDYTFSRDKFEKNSNFILMKLNKIGTVDFEFTENQNKQAEDFVKNQLRNMFDQKISVKAYNEPSETREEKRAKIRRLEAETGQIGKKESEFNSEADRLFNLTTGNFKNTADLESTKDWVTSQPVGKNEFDEQIYFKTFNPIVEKDGTINYEYSYTKDYGGKKAGQKYITQDIRDITDRIYRSSGAKFEEYQKIYDMAENKLNKYGGSFERPGAARQTLMKTGGLRQFVPSDNAPANTNPADKFKANTGEAAKMEL